MPVARTFLPQNMRFSYIPVWVPADFYLAISVSRRRLLEVPTLSECAIRDGHRAFRFECCVLLHVCCILDVKRITLNAVNQQRQRLP
jgi:hypothetical protein